jgi:oxygen-independent coproporphyrinogen-3 oxidase
MPTTLKFDPHLVEKYGVSGPRYTSYPTAPQFHEGFDVQAYKSFVAQSNQDLIPRPLSLYVHLPFCHSLCYFCGCHKKIVGLSKMPGTYLHHLHSEIELQGKLFDADREVIQLHFGGGTPTFYDDTELHELVAQLGRYFNLSSAKEREFSIEIDPRTVDEGRLEKLAETGFNRLSFGVQDFDPAVQKAVNRVQDKEHTLGLVDAARTHGFNSVSIDLIYGLPLQTPASFAETLDAVVEARPDRLAVYAYAHLPEKFRAQKMLKTENLPDSATRLKLMQLTIEKLTTSGYEYIGMDHFALPDDELVKARKKGHLQRNFQGYSIHGNCDLVGLGASAISKVGYSYSQNLTDLRQWQASVDSGVLPVWRGISLNRDDLIRRTVIESIMCHGNLNWDELESRFSIDYPEYFAREMRTLNDLERDGLITQSDIGIAATPMGMVLLRVIAMVFDKYLQPELRATGFSRVI